jgi:hypothetical protein
MSRNIQSLFSYDMKIAVLFDWCWLT